MRTPIASGLVVLLSFRYQSRRVPPCPTARVRPSTQIGHRTYPLVSDFETVVQLMPYQSTDHRQPASTRHYPLTQRRPKHPELTSRPPCLPDAASRPSLRCRSTKPTKAIGRTAFGRPTLRSTATCATGPRYKKERRAGLLADDGSGWRSENAMMRCRHGMEARFTPSGTDREQSAALIPRQRAWARRCTQCS
jgi:hypothetical protein